MPDQRKPDLGAVRFAVVQRHPGPRIEHWNGTAWKVQPSAALNSPQILTDVAATSRTNAWAVGDYVSGKVHQILIEHWNGTAWEIQPSASPGVMASLSAVAATSRTNAWAVGCSNAIQNRPRCSIEPARGYEALALH